MNIWKMWFFIGVLIALIVAFHGLFKNQILAIVLALGFAIWKVFRPNIWVHNGTELFIYGGLEAIFVNILNVFGAFMLLLLISVYDIIAVWKSKHMVKLAKLQTKSKVFAGRAELHCFSPLKQRGSWCRETRETFGTPFGNCGMQFRFPR